MAVLSILRYGFSARSAAQSLLFRRNQLVPLKNNIISRYASHRSMKIVPSRYEWQIFKDHLHFYVALGLIPLGLFIFFMNVFVGPAELSEIPEDYTPENYEYFQNPVKRFMVKYFYPDPVHRYESNLHYLKQSDDNQKFKLLESKVKQLMSERGDYKGWYYVPVDPTAAYLGREQRKTEEAIVLDR